MEVNVLANLTTCDYWETEETKIKLKLPEYLLNKYLLNRYMLIPTEKIEYNYRFKNLSGRYWEISINCINQKYYQEKNVPELFLKHRKNIETEMNQSWSLYTRFKISSCSYIFSWRWLAIVQGSSNFLPENIGLIQWWKRIIFVFAWYNYPVSI